MSLPRLAARAGHGLADLRHGGGRVVLMCRGRVLGSKLGKLCALQNEAIRLRSSGWASGKAFSAPRGTDRDTGERVLGT